MAEHLELDPESISRFHYYDDTWRETTFKCDRCGWAGRLRQDAEMEILDATGSWYSCPACGKGLAWVVFRTYKELQEKAESGDPEAIKEWRTGQSVLQRRESYEREKLKGPDQLPEVDGETLDFEWDIVGEENKDGPGYITS